jgi:hypothetical protein
MSNKTPIPCLRPVDIGDGVSYVYVKYWGSNTWAGEGLESNKGDTSGCLRKPGCMPLGCCSRPIAVFQRVYSKGNKSISAVLSYPHGLAAEDNYFWEIYPCGDGDIDRFSSEEEMEKAIKKELSK